MPRDSSCAKISRMLIRATALFSASEQAEANLFLIKITVIGVNGHLSLRLAQTNFESTSGLDKVTIKYR